LNKHFELPGDQGMTLLVNGDLPVAAGLSSSTALVVACGLAYLDTVGIDLDRDITRAELAEVLAEAEHFTGTQGGCMDHGIQLLGGEGHASKLDFNPLRAESAPLLEGYAFVVCHSRVTARKSGAQRHRYNAGPRLARLIRALVERHTQETFDPEIEVPRIGDLWQGALCLTHDEATQLFEGALPHDRTPLSVAASILEYSEDEIRETIIGDLPEPDGGFPLRARARHFCTEYARVEGGRDALLVDDAETFGRLMNESHTSCAGDYDVSGPELEQLVAIAREGGAIGSRLTGAGFGGCTVNLVPIDRLESFQAHVQDRYYTAYLGKRDDLAEVAEPILIAHSSPAAGYVSL
jgi:N-acetylgalactosamine kinase